MNPPTYFFLRTAAGVSFGCFPSQVEAEEFTDPARRVGEVWAQLPDGRYIRVERRPAFNVRPALASRPKGKKPALTTP